MIRQELNPETCRLDTKQCRYVYTGPGGCLRWPPTPPGPRWPPALKLELELERERTKEEKEREVLHLFRCYTHTHIYISPLYSYYASFFTRLNQMNPSLKGQFFHHFPGPEAGGPLRTQGAAPGCRTQRRQSGPRAIDIIP